MARAYLERYYGDQVTIEYHDVAQEGVEARFRDLIAQAPAGYVLYPLLFVQGQAKGAGGVEYFAMFQAVREALEGRQTLSGPVMG
jgi:disulfide oxidoreductase YuzD